MNHWAFNLVGYEQKKEQNVCICCLLKMWNRFLIHLQYNDSACVCLRQTLSVISIDRDVPCLFKQNWNFQFFLSFHIWFSIQMNSINESMKLLCQQSAISWLWFRSSIESFHILLRILSCAVILFWGNNWAFDPIKMDHWARTINSPSNHK